MAQYNGPIWSGPHCRQSQDLSVAWHPSTGGHTHRHKRFSHTHTHTPKTPPRTHSAGRPLAITSHVTPLDLEHHGWKHDKSEMGCKWEKRGKGGRDGLDQNCAQPTEWQIRPGSGEIPSRFLSCQFRQLLSGAGQFDFFFKPRSCPKALF